jgi:hypothetical protein
MNQELNERIAEILLGKIESGKIDVNFINKMLEGNLQPENFKGTGMMGVGLYPEMQRPFRKKKVTSLSMEQLNKGESKSIDDIISASDIAQFLSAATADKVNVDASEMPMENRPFQYSSSSIIDYLQSLQNNTMPSDQQRMDSFFKRLEDLAKPKPKTS